MIRINKEYSDSLLIFERKSTANTDGGITSDEWDEIRLVFIIYSVF